MILTRTTMASTIRAAAAVSLLALGLAACAADPKSPAVGAVNPGELYPLKVDAQSDRIALAVHAGGLSPAQAEALKALAQRRRDQQGGVVSVSVPHGAVDAGLAGKHAVAAEAVLQLEGAETRLTSYESDDAKAPVLVSYAYDAPVVAACGKHWDDLTHTGDNRVQSNFGCAITANMAAQIANPSDIARPQLDSPADVTRRVTVMSAYQEGKSTASESKDDKSSIVSRVAP